MPATTNPVHPPGSPPPREPLAKKHSTASTGGHLPSLCTPGPTPVGGCGHRSEQREGVGQETGSGVSGSVLRGGVRQETGPGVSGSVGLC